MFIDSLIVKGLGVSVSNEEDPDPYWIECTTTVYSNINKGVKVVYQTTQDWLIVNNVFSGISKSLNDITASHDFCYMTPYVAPGMSWYASVSYWDKQDQSFADADGVMLRWVVQVPAVLLVWGLVFSTVL